MIPESTKDLSLDEILSRLDNVKQEASGQYRADCPAHESKSGSALHIKAGEDGKPVLYCFAKCSYEDIMRALDLWRSDYPSSWNVTPIKRPAPKQDPPKTYSTKKVYSSRVFEFRSPSGEVAYVQRHKGAYYRPIGNDVWEASIQNVTRLPYNLPELLDGVRAGKTVYHLEGCKDCDTAREWLGVPATTSGGADSWRPEFKSYYIGADVVVIRDNDEEGRKYAETVARDLLQVAKSVKVVTLPDLPPKGDLTDFKEQGRSKEAFFKVINDTPNYDYPDYPDSSNYPDYPDYPTPISAAKLLETVMEPVKWAVPDVLPEGVTLLAGKPKQGKSWAALGLCEAIAGGGVAFGVKKVEQGETLYLALEDNYRRMQKRLKKLLNGRECPAGMYVNTEWPRLEEGGADALDRWLDEHPDARLIVIDTLAKVRKPARGKNVYQEDYSALEVLLPMAAKHGVAIVVVHHLRKGEAADAQDEISGSTGLAGGVDGYLILRRKPGSRGPTLFVDGRDIEEPQEYALHWNLNTASWTIEGTAEEVHISKERADILLELNRSPEPMTPKEVAEMLPAQKYANIKVLLRNMLQDDQVIKSGVGKYEPRHRTDPDYPTDYPDKSHSNGKEQASGNRVIEVIEDSKGIPVSFTAKPGEKASLEELKARRQCPPKFPDAICCGKPDNCDSMEWAD